jgi:hypothetical protein
VIFVEKPTWICWVQHTLLKNRRKWGYDPTLQGSCVLSRTPSVEVVRHFSRSALYRSAGQPTDIVLGVGNPHAALRRDCANVVCRDDDPRGSVAWKQANKAIRVARAVGHVVLIVNMWPVRRGDKTDLNDILRESAPGRAGAAAPSPLHHALSRGIAAQARPPRRSNPAGRGRRRHVHAEHWRNPFIRRSRLRLRAALHSST